MIHPILKMGDARLLRVAEPVREFDTPQLHRLIDEMFETMHDAGGAGLAPPGRADAQRAALRRSARRQGRGRGPGL